MTTTRGRQNPSKFNPFLAGLLVLVAIAGTMVTLELTGKTDLGFLDYWTVEAKDEDSSRVGVLVTMRPIDPGVRIDLQHVYDPETKGLRMAPVNRETAQEKGYARDIRLIKGRVLRKPKSTNEPFEPSDFLPKGSPPGIVGLVPEGMELLMIEADSVQGIEALGFENRFDLKVTDSLDSEVKRAVEEALETGEHVSPGERLRFAAASAGSRQRVLAQNGMVIKQSNGNEKKRMIAVALHPDDVDSTLAALADERTIYCIARAGNGSASEERVVYEVPDPMEEYEWLLKSRQEVEVIKGNARSVGIVPEARPR